KIKDWYSRMREKITRKLVERCSRLNRLELIWKKLRINRVLLRHQHEQVFYAAAAQPRLFPFERALPRIKLFGGELLQAANSVNPPLGGIKQPAFFAEDNIGQRRDVKA